MNPKMDRGGRAGDEGAEEDEEAEDDSEDEEAARDRPGSGGGGAPLPVDRASSTQQSLKALHREAAARIRRR